MSENNEGQGSGRKKRRRRRRRRSGGKNSGSGGKNSGSRSNNKNRSNRKRGGRSGRKSGGGGNRSGRKRSGRRKSNKREKFGGREPVAQFEKRTGPIPLNPFELFVSYYMGVTDDNRYSKPSMGNTARKFSIQPEDVEQALRNCGMDKHTLRDVDYDMSLAQLDVRVAPDGIDKREIARNLFDEFIEVNPHFVDMSEEEICNAVDIDLEQE
jgi:hypothetical protein